MEPYKRFINKIYVKKFNHFLKTVVEKKFEDKYHQEIKLKLYGIKIKPKNKVYSEIPVEELLDTQANVLFFIDSEPSINDRGTFIADTIINDGGLFLNLSTKNIWAVDTFEAKFYLNKRPLYPLDYQSDEELNESVEPSEKAIKNICDAKKFCSAQGKITFGQLKEIVTNAKTKRLLQHIGEGGYKATLRLLPWFFPQLAIAGFTGSLLRAFNKIFRPSIEETTGYKTWWGKTIMKIFNLVEGDLGISDPLSKIFFISDGLMTMLDDKLKVKFARYIAEVASEKPDDEEVPEFFVENELRKYLNEKFLLDPPLQSKEFKGEPLNEGQYGYEDSEEYYEKIDKLLNKFLSATGKEKDMSNFIGYKVLTGKNRYGDFTVKLTGVFEKPFSGEDSDTIHKKSREMTKLLKKIFPFLRNATFFGGSTSTLDNYKRYLNLEKQYLNRKVKEDEDEDNLPFLQEEKNGIKRRVFKEHVSDHELKWHFDKKDRKVKIVKSNGWKIQLDDKLPKIMNEGDTLFIPKGVYHRVIKGKGDLIIKIREY